ncbi:MAG TPA: diiron oxygenase [Gammaproteobacteria bacterium]
MDNVVTLSQKLSKASVKRYSNPYLEFDWPEVLSEDSWWFSPELSSLCGTAVYDVLPAEQQQRLAFWELVNFFSLNIHGEKALLQGLAKRLYSRWPTEISEYLHHFLGEENKHMTLFGTFCMRYANKVYPSKAYSLNENHIQSVEDFLFFARVVIFEEFVDYYNLYMAKDERLHPLCRAINQYHHNDESRHLAFGRKITQQLFESHAGDWGEDTVNGIRRYLGDYIQATWKEYYNPWVYKDAGFNDFYKTYLTAWRHESQKQLRQKISSHCFSFFVTSGILAEEPVV